MDTKPNYLLCAHYWTSVPFDDLLKYFNQNNAAVVTAIKLPLFIEQNTYKASLEEYRYGVLSKTKKISYRLHIPPLRYLYDILTILRFGLQSGHVDIALGLDNLCALSCVMLRLIRRVNKVIYYSIDFTPNRFNNAIANKAFHYLDGLSVKLADLTWNISPRIKQGREKRNGLVGKEYQRQVVVPVGTWIEEYGDVQIQKKRKHTLMYAGGLADHQGIDLVIKSLPQVALQIPDIQLRIIGVGKEEDKLKGLAKELNLTDKVTFLGYFPNHADVIKELTKGSVALAMYNGEFARWSYYGDPSKIKSYLACGLPTLTTDVTYIAQDLVAKNCGYVVKYTKEDLANAIKDIFQDDHKLELMQQNCQKYAQEFNWTTIFQYGLESLDRLSENT